MTRPSFGTRVSVSSASIRPREHFAMAILRLTKIRNRRWLADGRQAAISADESMTHAGLMMSRSSADRARCRFTLRDLIFEGFNPRLPGISFDITPD